MLPNLEDFLFPHDTWDDGCKCTQSYLWDKINEPLFDCWEYMQCLPVSKPDTHQSPCLPRERSAQGWLCAAPTWTKHTDTWPNKDSESGLKQQHLPGVAFEGVREVERLETIPRLLQIRDVAEARRGHSLNWLDRTTGNRSFGFLMNQQQTDRQT